MQTVKGYRSAIVVVMAGLVGLVAPAAYATRCERTVGVDTDIVDGFSTITYQECLVGGRITQIVVEGDGDSDLDLFVFDPFGRLVAYDDDATDLCVVEFWAKAGGSYKIEVRNRGRLPNVYTIAVD